MTQSSLKDGDSSFSAAFAMDSLILHAPSGTSHTGDDIHAWWQVEFQCPVEVSVFLCSNLNN